MSKEHQKSLNSVLFNAFANEYWTKSREDEELIKEANREGLIRLKNLDPFWQDWREVTANKEHQCERGCQIKSRDQYFQYKTGVGRGEHLKICKRCMAMLLYFSKAQNLPVSRIAGWSD
jgi:hypothetical protein